MNRTKQKLLATLLLSPDRRWYHHELSRQLELPPSSLQRDLRRLAEAGIVIRSDHGNRSYYQANSACPILPELQRLLVKTVGLVDEIRAAMVPLLPRIEFAFVYGSVAAAAEHAASDVDLMIVGDVDMTHLAVRLREAERILARSVNPTLYSPPEFRQRLREDDHFLHTVLGRETIWIHGASHELERTIAVSPGEKASDQPLRDQRAAGDC